MALKSIQNYDYRGTQPNFVRDQFATYAAMLAWPVTDIDTGHISYCVETGKTYIFTGTSWAEMAGKVMYLTQAQYDAIAVKDPTTQYNIFED